MKIKNNLRTFLLVSTILGMPLFLDCGNSSDSGSSAVSLCGNNELNSGEQCDDGNAIAGDGCGASCLLEASACTSGSVELDRNPEMTVVVCDDPADVTCEEDLATLCPGGWDLCTFEQYHNRNSTWTGIATTQSTVGEIQCRSASSAGMWRLVAGNNFGDDTGYSCVQGSSRDTCTSTFGCNEQQTAAFCCAPTGNCGDGIVDAPEELCDDGNKDETDDCLDTCTWRKPFDQGVAGC